MGKFTEVEINKIINLHGANGEPIDIFDLHGILYVGNTKTVNVVQNGVLVPKEIWDLTERYTKFSEHSLPIFNEDFDWCETEEEVREQFATSLKEAINSKLL